MADSDEEESCCSCFDLTKYTCIGCTIPICNICSVFDEDEGTSGWQMGKSVGRCQACLFGNTCSSRPQGHKDTSELEPKRKRTKGNESEDDYTSTENGNEHLQKKTKKKAGRKTRWSNEAIDDFIDIVANNEYYQRKLIFTNTKHQQNGMIYQTILTELKARCSARGEEINFTASQLRTKFKKCVSDCKVAALTIKTATGIKRFQEDKGFGAWFNTLFALVKSRDSCNPEQAVEPSAEKTTTTDETTNKDDATESVNEDQHLFIPVKAANKKSKKSDPVCEAIDLLRKTIENDPSKDMIAFMRDEVQKSREHEMMLMKMMVGANYSGQQQQGYGASNFPQQHGIGMSNIQHQQVYSQTNETMPTPLLHASNQGYGLYREPQGHVGITTPSHLQALSYRSFRPDSPDMPLSSCSSSSSRSSTPMSSLDGQLLDERNYHQL